MIRPPEQADRDGTDGALCLPVTSVTGARLVTGTRDYLQSPETKKTKRKIIFWCDFFFIAPSFRLYDTPRDRKRNCHPYDPRLL